MLLESSLWSKEGYALRWEVKPLFSERVETFMSSAVPTPSSESARSLRVSDIQSSRCLFQLVPSALPTEGTECSSSLMLKTSTTMDAASENMQSKGISGTSGTLAQEIRSGYVERRGLFLLTPTAVMTKEEPEEMRARAEKNGYKNGTKFGSLESQVMYDPTVAGMLPTPSARDWKPPYNPDAMQRKNGMMRDDQLSAIPTMLGLKERGGITFRLSPLFTQEMMGFPRLWTELPWVSQSGAQKASKPTETQ
jgi:hypothetical protein